MPIYTIRHPQIGILIPITTYVGVDPVRRRHLFCPAKWRKRQPRWFRHLRGEGTRCARWTQPANRSHDQDRSGQAARFKSRQDVEGRGELSASQNDKRACELRLLPVPIREVEWRSCCFPSPYHGVLAVKGCARRARLRRAGCRPLTAALRRAGRESGNVARVTGARSCRSYLLLLTLPC